MRRVRRANIPPKGLRHALCDKWAIFDLFCPVAEVITVFPHAGLPQIPARSKISDNELKTSPPPPLCLSLSRSSHHCGTQRKSTAPPHPPPEPLADRHRHRTLKIAPRPGTPNTRRDSHHTPSPTRHSPTSEPASLTPHWPHRAQCTACTHRGRRWNAELHFTPPNHHHPCRHV